MKAIILDSTHRYIKTLSGTYKNGAFYYKPTILGSEEHFDYDPTHSTELPFGIRKKIERVAIYTFDGKNYKQESLKEKTGEYNIVDYIQTYKIAELQRKLIMPEQNQWAKIAGIIMMILVLVTIIATYYAIKGDVALANQSSAVSALNKTASTCTQAFTYFINASKREIKLYNQTLNYCNATRTH